MTSEVVIASLAFPFSLLLFSPTYKQRVSIQRSQIESVIGLNGEDLRSEAREDVSTEPIEGLPEEKEEDKRV
jgi:hypothetical protein